MEPARHHGSICKTHPVQKVGENTAKRKLLTPKRINLEKRNNRRAGNCKNSSIRKSHAYEMLTICFQLKKKYLQNARALASRTLNYFDLSS